MNPFRKLNRIGEEDQRRLSIVGLLILAFFFVPVVYWVCYLVFIPFKWLFDLINVF